MKHTGKWYVTPSVIIAKTLGSAVFLPYWSLMAWKLSVQGDPLFFSYKFAGGTCGLAHFQNGEERERGIKDPFWCGQLRLECGAHASVLALLQRQSRRQNRVIYLELSHECKELNCIMGHRISLCSNKCRGEHDIIHNTKKSHKMYVLLKHTLSLKSLWTSECLIENLIKSLKNWC